MQNLLTFLKSRQFFLQLGIIVVLAGLILFITLKWLSSYTSHGDFVIVPDFKGQAVSNLDEFIDGKDVSYQIIDSIYDPKEKSGIVLRQDPETDSKVKHNRTIYLYVTGMVAPQVHMPKLIDRSERQARLILGSYGLKVGKITDKQADCNGCVLAQLVKGKEIEQGANIKKGTVVDLVVGRKDAYYGNSADTSSVFIPEEEPNFE
jgi:eukaryotic-like serine/threonine-protein kinase